MQTSDNQAPLIVAKPGGRVFSKYLPPQEEKTILKKATIGAMSLHLLVYFVSPCLLCVYLCTYYFVSISMRHVYLHAPCQSACVSARAMCMCMQHMYVACMQHVHVACMCHVLHCAEPLST